MSALSTITSYLPYMSLPPVAGAMATVVVLLLTESSPGTTTTMETLAIRVKQLAVPVFVGFLLGSLAGLGSCPGMMLAVGLSRLYRAYTEPRQLPDTAKVEKLSQALAPFSRLTNLIDWTIPTAESAIASNIQSLFEGCTDHTERLETAFRLLDMIPFWSDGAPAYKTVQSTLLSIAFKALFKVSDPYKFPGDDITTFAQMPAHCLSYHHYNSMREYSLGLKHGLHFGMLLERFNTLYPNTVCTNSIATMRVSDEFTLAHSATENHLSLDELVALSQVSYREYCKQTQFGIEQVQLSFRSPIPNASPIPLRRLSESLGDILHDMAKEPTTSPADRLKIAQAYAMFCPDEQGKKVRREILAAGLQSGWVESKWLSITSLNSLEELAILVGAGYLELNDPHDSNSGTIDQGEYDRRYLNIHETFETLCKNEGSSAQSIMEGALGFLQQLHWEQKPSTLTFNWYEPLIAMMTNPQEPLTIDGLLSCYTQCYLLDIPNKQKDSKQHQSQLVKMLRQQLMTVLNREVESATQSEIYSAIEVTTRILAATTVAGDYDFAHEVAQRSTETNSIGSRQSFQAIEEAIALGKKEQERKTRHFWGAVTTIGGIVLACLRI